MSPHCAQFSPCTITYVTISSRSFFAVLSHYLPPLKYNPPFIPRPLPSLSHMQCSEAVCRHDDALLDDISERDKGQYTHQGNLISIFSSVPQNCQLLTGLQTHTHTHIQSNLNIISGWVKDRQRTLASHMITSPSSEAVTNLHDR